ncbi:class I SAM-dependent methyltransferase [Burkholderia plantarii]|uniref:class I SAM-dependent methyltransferase n=1 Tax=Burkholderia plantarii TaxID=41899 RepID=UPI00114C9AC1|nr:class I SAM-dependent methyltransferase [Burkholderia plantarii]
METSTMDSSAAGRDFAGQYTRSFVDRWDELINWDGRAKAENGFFQALLAEHGVVRVLDVACGTGYHAIDLQRAGFDVTASDGSATMVEKTRENARVLALTLPSHVADWRTLADAIDGSFDAVVCLGSSFCHLRGEDDRRAALAQFQAVLKPGGLLLVDQRNFDAILAGNYRTAGNVAYCGRAVQVHFENVGDDNVDFVYSFDNGDQYRLSVHPIRAQALRGALEDTGFDYLQSYGDFDTQYDPLSCGFVLHVARKPVR